MITPSADIQSQLNEVKIDFEKSFNAFEQEGKKVKKSRVSVKKIRTYLRLAEYIFPEEFNYNSFNTSIKFFFQKAGELRDLQLQLKYLRSKNISIIEFITFLEEEVQRKESDIKQLDILPIKKSIALELDRIILHFSKLEDEFLHYKTAQYMSSQEKVYKKLLKKISYEEDIHNVRKMLKHIFFMSEVFQLSIFNQGISKQKERLKKIGNWNDMVVRIERLDDFLTMNHAKVKSIRIYTQFLNQEKAEAKKLILSVFGKSVLSKYFD